MWPIALLTLIVSSGGQECMACNLALYFGSSFSNISFQKISRSMSNSLDFGFDTSIMVFPLFVEVAIKQIGVLISFGSIEVVVKAPSTKVVVESIAI
jgi:hypothetical protein